MADQPDTYQIVSAEQVLIPVDGLGWRPTGRSFRSTYRLGGAPVLLTVEVQAAPDAEWWPLQLPGAPESSSIATSNGAAS